MTTDPKIQEAIKVAVEEAGWNQALSRKLIQWFKAIASGNENINDKQSAHRHLELLYREIPDELDDDQELS